MAHSVDPDEMAHYEPSHLDLHYLHRKLFWSAGLKELSPSVGISPVCGTTVLPTGNSHWKQVFLLRTCFFLNVKLYL